MRTIDHNIIDIALDRTDGSSFENFSQAFFSAVFGIDFVPLGGTHDGGADAFIEASVFEAQAGKFLQASVQADHRPKIRATVRRLREFERQPKQLIYSTSRIVPKIDVEESELSDELDVAVRIRDRKYFVGHINESPQCVQAFDSYLSPHIAFLEKIGGATLIRQSPNLPARDLCVFLGQELERRSGNTQLLEAVTDSLILWALEDTDPETAVLMDRTEIRAKIEAALPSAKHFIRNVMDHRLEALASKQNTDGREVRWYKKRDKFCLPFEMRQIVAEENREDEALKTRVSEIFEASATQDLGEIDDPELLPAVIALSHRALEATFEKQGLEMVYFLSGDEPDRLIKSTIYDTIEECAEQSGLAGEDGALIKETALQVLRRTFYDSTTEERLYLSKLSRTYILLFVLRNEPKIVEYFRAMSANFVLYVGADLIIRGLSEQFLDPEDKMTANLFAILSSAGSVLILTDRTLEEVYTHICAADFEYREHYREIDRYIDPVFARHIDRILIRAYFYSKHDPSLGTKRPASWQSFLGQFSTYPDLHNQAGRESLKRSLCEEFGLVFEPEEETLAGVDEDEISLLAKRIAELRQWVRKEKQHLLAYNDALQIHRVYVKRRELGEGRKPNPYGYRTWWLTQETAVRRATRELVAKRGATYIIRPEFLLNFIALSPSTEEVRRSYKSIFPTLLGVRLSNRMRPELFEKVVAKINEAHQISEPRARALVSELADKLKSDHFKQYEHELMPVQKMYR